jgi:hypothetical protein
MPKLFPRACVATMPDPLNPERSYNFCIIPEQDFECVARAFYILAGAVGRDAYGITVRIGSLHFVAVPDTVEARTLAHEAVHLASDMGYASLGGPAEERFASVVGHLSSDMMGVLDGIRRRFAKERRKAAKHKTKGE